MDNFQNEIDALVNIKNGFKEIKQLSIKIVESGLNHKDLYIQSKELYSSTTYQIRMLAVFILGHIAHKNENYISFLKHTVSLDENWRVQEILAMAFDMYCKNIGYSASLETIDSWLLNENPNVRRAVTEGLRIWTSRDYFKDNPDYAIDVLSNLKADNSEYVRKSVGKALRDISKKHPEKIKKELLSWDKFDKKTLLTFKLASKFINVQN